MPRKLVNLSLTSVILLFVTIVFTIFTVNDWFEKIDDSLQQVLTAWDSHILEIVLTGITFLAYTKMLALLSILTVVVLYLRKEIKLIFLYLLVMSGGVIITFIMKIAIERDRPGETSYVDFWGLGKDIISYSFPSGHAVKALLFFGFLSCWVYMRVNHRRWKHYLIGLCIGIALMVGVGQIMLNRHYLTDVIGGYLVGITWLGLSLVMMEAVSDLYYRKKNLQMKYDSDVI